MTEPTPPVVPLQDGTIPDSAVAPGDAAPRTSRWDSAARERERELLGQLAASTEGDAAHTAARDELVTMHLPLVHFLARRFRDRGEPLEDLVQVGTIGLIKAVDRFDPERGVEFSTYATPTIVGEIKRHFRDKGWAIRVPRRLQELRISIAQATAELSQSSGHSPTIGELATHLGISEEHNEKIPWEMSRCYPDICQFNLDSIARELPPYGEEEKFGTRLNIPYPLG